MLVSSTWGIAAPSTLVKSRLAGSATRPMVIDPAEPPPDPPVEPPVDPGFVDDPAVHALTARASEHHISVRQRRSLRRWRYIRTLERSDRPPPARGDSENASLQ